jgi:hypothetical protein
MVELQKKYGGVREYGPNDPAFANDPYIQEARNKAGITNPNESVPAHRVYPEIMRAARQDAMLEAGKLISDKERRGNFAYAHETSMNKTYLSDTVTASKNQLLYADQQSAELVGERMREKDYAGAGLAVIQSQWTPVKKVAMMKGITTERQKNYFNETLKNSKIQDMEVALAKLEDPNDKDSSGLTEQEEKVFASQLRAGIKREENKTSGNAQMGLALLRDDATKVTNAYNNGDMVDVIYGQQIHQRLVVAGEEVKARNLEWSMQASGAIYDLNQGDIGPMMKAANSRIYAGTGQEAYTQNVIRTAAKKNIKAQRSDTMKFMGRNSVGDVVPINFGSPAEMIPTLQKRIGAYDLAVRKYGYSSGYMTTAEAAEFSDRVDKANSPQEKAEIFASVDVALGDRAPQFYEELKNKNMGGTTMLAGQLYADGLELDALTIIKGRQARIDYPDVVTRDIRDTLDAQVVANFGNLFAGNLTQRSLTHEAVYDAYAQLSVDKGDLKGRIDTGRMETAIQIATGGILDYNGSQIQAPAKDVTNRDFKNWIRDTDSIIYSDMNVPSSMSTERIKEKIEDDDWHLQGVGRGIYNIIAENGLPIANRNKSTKFELKFDLAAPQAYDAPDAAELARIKRRLEYEANTTFGKNPDRRFFGQ